MRCLLRCLAAVALLATGCGGESDPARSSTPTTTGHGGSGGTGAGGGGGGGASTAVCVAFPDAAPVGGDDACPAAQPSTPDVLDAALAAGGLSRCDVHLTPGDLSLAGIPKSALFDARQLPSFAALQLGPLRVPAFGRETAAWLDDAAASKHPVSGTIAALAARRGAAAGDRCSDVAALAPPADDASPLAAAVLRLDADHGQPGDEAAVRAAAEGVPIEVQKRLAPVVAAVDLAASEVRAALATTDAADLKYLGRAAGLFLPSFAFGLALDKASLARLDTVDVDRIAAAAALLARVVEDADLGSLDAGAFAPFEVDTPLGPIAVHDGADDVYEAKGPADGAALLVDVGGDDTYRVTAGASSADRPVALVVDVRGRDAYGYHEVPSPLDGDLLPSDGKGRYGSPKPPSEDWGPITLSNTPRQGAGIAGIGMLLDLGAEGDTYRSLAASQGFAAMGVGVLYDAGGDDRYDGEAGAQAAATFGVAALVDASGADEYRSFFESQGFGGTKGAAALVDAAGDDQYLCDSGDPAEGGHPLYFSPQLPGIGNTSMSQGAASGRRPSGDPSYTAGGLGVLRDAAGADRYSASVFAQGAAYWEGTGLLLDGGAGADRYDGYWYVQGAAAHMSLALFVDEGGDDRYDQELSPKATSIGVGHDFSAALHVDLGGDDLYRAPGLSLGSGNLDGIGLFVNVGGDDTYVAAGDPTLGAGNYSAELPFGQPRQDAATIGVFVDAAGTDVYTVAGEARALDGTTWSYEPQPYPEPDVVTTEHGCGADAEGEATLP